MKNAAALCKRISTVPVLVIAVLLFAGFVGYILPHHKVQAEKYTGAAGTPDLSFFVQPEAVYAMAEAYGEEGRQKYIISKFTIDAVWPFVFTLLYLVAISLSFGYVHGERSARWGMLALSTLVLDYLENVLGAIVMGLYPARISALTWGLSLTTTLKWISMTVVSLLFCYGVMAVFCCFVYRRVKKVDRKNS